MWIKAKRLTNVSRQESFVLLRKLAQNGEESPGRLVVNCCHSLVRIILRLKSLTGSTVTRFQHVSRTQREVGQRRVGRDRATVQL